MVKEARRTPVPRGWHGSSSWWWTDKSTVENSRSECASPSSGTRLADLKTGRGSHLSIPVRGPLVASISIHHLFDINKRHTHQNDNRSSRLKAPLYDSKYTTPRSFRKTKNPLVVRDRSQAPDRSYHTYLPIIPASITRCPFPPNHPVTKLKILDRIDSPLRSARHTPHQNNLLLLLTTCGIPGSRTEEEEYGGISIRYTYCRLENHTEGTEQAKGSVDYEVHGIVLSRQD